ncbi:protein CFAP276-like [Convolutriloba macropyga]|uniref:protein CFAP276-like n=1 Tax=Convolutriloba macropyga TaxID=536237 RepID=UPI003F51AFF9
MIASSLMSSRDPYPFEKFQNDDNFRGKPAGTMPRVYKEATHLDQQKDPWNRLNMTPTLQSVRRRVNHFDPLAPNDALDFELKTSYDQHADLFQPSNYSVLQRETLNLPHGRVLKNREVLSKLPYDPMYPPLRVAEQERRLDPNNVKGAIVGVHTEITNPGYSRKTDGGIFTA